MKIGAPRFALAPIRTVARLSLFLIYRARIVALLAGLFIVLVMVSAFLGWSVTSTVNSIYNDAVVYLTAQGQPAPPNPVHDISPLSLMRNMSVYVSLIGALAAIVIGNHLIAEDRNSGVIPLVGARPVGRGQYVGGKIVALLSANGMLAGVAGVIAVITFLILPQVTLTAAGWGKLFVFFALAYGYMCLFGLVALGFAARTRTESVGLLFPVTFWLTVTFILPSLTANIHPTAAINPISALAPAPDTVFFHWTGRLVGPFSLAESFKYLSAGLLDYLPPTARSSSIIPSLPDLLLALILAAIFAVRSVGRMDFIRGGYDV